MLHILSTENITYFLLFKFKMTSHWQRKIYWATSFKMDISGNNPEYLQKFFFAYFMNPDTFFCWRFCWQLACSGRCVCSLISKFDFIVRPKAKKLVFEPNSWRAFVLFSAHHVLWKFDILDVDLKVIYPRAAVRFVLFALHVCKIE